MALIKCADCGNEMSDQAPACPKCGKPNPLASSAATQSVAATAQEPPASWNVASIVSGAIQLAIAAWVQFAFLPAHDAAKVGVWQAAGRALQGQDTWVLKPGAYLIVQGIVIVLAINGLLRVTVYAKRKPKK
jgi:hypothetical protein